MMEDLEDFFNCVKYITSQKVEQLLSSIDQLSVMQFYGGTVHDIRGLSVKNSQYNSLVIHKCFIGHSAAPRLKNTGWVMCEGISECLNCWKTSGELQHCQYCGLLVCGQCYPEENSNQKSRICERCTWRISVGLFTIFSFSFC
jgi:hypothetical protein